LDKSKFSLEVEVEEWKKMREQIPLGEEVGIIINATSLGLKGEEIPFALGKTFSFGLGSGYSLSKGINSFS
jgi:shikimate 5-dehydrogenase